MTDDTPDDRGCTVRTLGPAHSVDGQTVRTATWMVYKDADHETYNGHGYLVGSTSYTLINPVSITRHNDNGEGLMALTAVSDFRRTHEPAHTPPLSLHC